jgi:signal transduction histidine kinase
LANILVVDDNLNVRRYLEKLLTQRLHTVAEAPDVTRALAHCRASKPDLIITDVVMPGEDGYGFVRELRSDPGLADISIIFFTGSYYQEGDAKAFAEACGVACVLSKPAEPEKILAAVDSVLRSAKARSINTLPPDFDREHAQILGDKLFANVLALEAANAQLLASEQQLHRLAERLRSAQEEERTRIARQLHDELGQALTMLKMNSTWVLSRLTDAPEGVVERLRSSVQVADEMIRNVRTLATDLRPGILDLGIAAAIEWQAAEFQKRTEIECTVDLYEADGLIESSVATELFRIFQEAMTNVIRHAQATQVNIALKCDGVHLLLEILDNGKGISERDIANRNTLGLLGMRERASLIGGSFSITGSPDVGTTLSVTVPVRTGVCLETEGALNEAY